MKNFFVGVVGTAVFLVGCANEVTVEDADEAASSGATSSSSSTSSGAMAECTPRDDGPTTTQPTCQDLERLVLVEPTLAGDTDGDGLIEPEEMATLTVVMKDVSGWGFNWYPGVEFVTKDVSIGVTADTWYYAVLPCGEQPATATLKVAPDAAPGKTVFIRAQIAMLNTKCPDTFFLDVPVTVH